MKKKKRTLVSGTHFIASLKQNIVDVNSTLVQKVNKPMSEASIKSY